MNGERWTAAVVIVAALAVLIFAGVSPAWAQEIRMVSEEQTRLSREWTQQGERIQEIESEIDRLNEQPVSNREEVDRLEDELSELEVAHDETAEAYTLERVEVVESAPVTGTPQEQEAALEKKQNALTTLSTWADTNLPFGSDAGETVNAAEEEVGAQLADVEAEQAEQAEPADPRGFAGSGSDGGSVGGSVAGWLWARLWPLLLIGGLLVAVVFAVGAPVVHLMGGSVGGMAFRFFGKKYLRRYIVRRAKRRGLHLYDQNAPGVTIRDQETPADDAYAEEGTWTVAGETYDVPHIVCHAATGIGKNQTLLNATWANCLMLRPESCVMIDPKGDAVDEFLTAADEDAPQFVYSFLEQHETSSALNLVETPKMAAQTAAALYPVEGSSKPIFNQGARDLLESLADALGYAETSLVEIYRVLSDPDRLDELKKKHPGVRAAVGGKNEKFAGDVISSARLPLSALKNEEVARVFVPTPGTRQPHFTEKEIVYICIPIEGDYVKLLAGALMANLVARAMDSRRGTHFLVDEAGSVCTPEKITRYLATGRGLGAYFFLVLQDAAQLEDALGKPKSRSALGNARVQFFGQTTETGTAGYLEELSGHVNVPTRHYHEERTAFTKAAEFFGAEREFTYSEQRRPRIYAEHVYNLRPGQWFVWNGRAEELEMVNAAYWYTYAESVVGEPLDPLLVGIPEPSEEPPQEPPREEPRRRPRRPQGPPPRPRRRPEHARPSSPDSGDPRASDGFQGTPRDRTSGVGVDGRSEAPEPRRCPSCNVAQGDLKAKFCSECGSRL